jgi:hypothetical protein
MNFKEYINEVFTIVKKVNTRLDFPSSFNTIKVIRTNHSKQNRGNSTKSRDNNLSNSTIIKVFKKAWKKGLYADDKTMITYKQNNKYNMLVLSWDEVNNKIILITNIEGYKNNPSLYFTKSHKDRSKILTEKIIKLENI